MIEAEYSADDWIDRLASTLRRLAKEQEPWLKKYYEEIPFVHVMSEGSNGISSDSLLDHLRHVYAIARLGGKTFGEKEHYLALRKLLDPARHILRSHPTLGRVMSLIIGEDNFWIQVLGNGQSICLTDLVAGLVVRAAKLPGDGFVAAATELEAFLDRAWIERKSCVPGNLDTGYDAVLFYGLNIKKRIDIANDMAIFPFEQVQAFVEKSQIKKLSPQGAGLHGWQSVGAVVRSFQWKPKFYREGNTRSSGPNWSEVEQPEIFFQQAVVFLELLAVAHTTPVLRLAMLPQCIKHSAGQLLGGVSRSGSFSQGRSAQGFDGFEVCPELAPENLAIAREAFDNRDHKRFEKMAPIIGRLDEALARDGRFASEDKILDVAIALERMYQLDRGEISRKMQTRVARFLGDGAESRLQEMETIKKFYNTRSSIVHNKRKQNSPERNQEIFNEGFSIAKRTLFKLLHEGAPNWEKFVVSAM